LGFAQRPQTSNWYLKVDDVATWADAERYCNIFDANLPSIHDQRENDHIQGKQAKNKLKLAIEKTRLHFNRNNPYLYHFNGRILAWWLFKPKSNLDMVR
jgi:hypothetical protein